MPMRSRGGVEAPLCFFSFRFRCMMLWGGGGGGGWAIGRVELMGGHSWFADDRYG